MKIFAVGMSGALQAIQLAGMRSHGIIRHGWLGSLGSLGKFNIPETNSQFAPENRGPLEKEIPIGNHHFQGLC